MSEESLQLELKNKRICRFCMTQNEPLTNIYSRENRLKSSAPLPLQIMACVSIEVFTNDGMPSTICDNCRMFMEHCYRFKQMCKKSDNALRQYPLTGIWPKSLEIPKLCEELIFKMYPDLYQKQKIIASTQTDKKDQKIPAKTYNLPISPAASQSSSSLTIVANNPSLTLSAHHQPSQVQQQRPPRLLNKNSVKILNKDAQRNPEPILSQPIIKRDSAGNVEIITEIIEQVQDESSDPIKTATPVETNVFPCVHCERSFPLRQLLDIHMVNHNRERSFQCNICAKSFFSKYDLGKHMLIHTGEKPYECVVCKRAFTRSTLLYRHEKIHTDQPKFLCVYCEKPFLSKEEMDKHTERHKKNRPFVCKICNKAFAFKQGLERHETVHAKDQPYPCQYCDHSFSTPSKLARHLTAHAGDRPFPCKLCPKSYLLSHHLTRHLRSHKQSSGSYKCFDCEKIFTTRDDLIYHSAVHATQTLICPLCKEHFNDLDCVTEHIKNHAEGEQFACEFCDLIFMTAEKLQAHSDSEHLEDLAAYQEHDKNVSVKNEMNPNFTDDSQESLNNEEVIEEFIIEEYHHDDDESQQQQQQQTIEQQVVRKEHEIVLGKDIIITARSRNDEKRVKQQNETVSCKNSSDDAKPSKFMQEFEEYNDEIDMEIENLVKDEDSAEYFIDQSIEPPPAKTMKLSSLKEVSGRKDVSKTSHQQTRKSIHEKKHQTTQAISTNLFLKQLPKSVTITKKEIPVAGTSSSQEPPARKMTHTINTEKVLPSSTKGEKAKKTPATATSNSQENVTKQIEVSKPKIEKNSQKTKESPKDSSSGSGSRTSQTKEKRTDSSPKQTASSRLPETKAKSQNKKLVEMIIGDRKVKVQKIIMTKAQVALMAKEGKIEMKGGAMILKQDNNKSRKSDSIDDNSKIMTRSKQQQQQSTGKNSNAK